MEAHLCGDLRCCRLTGYSEVELLLRDSPILSRGPKAFMRWVVVCAHPCELDSPARVSGIINSMLCATIAADRFVTFFCAVLDAAERTFVYCNAGHPYPILVSSGTARTLNQGGAVLGVLPGWRYQDATVKLACGDRLILFTGGITEAQDSEGRRVRHGKSGRFRHIACRQFRPSHQSPAPGAGQRVLRFPFPGRRHAPGSGCAVAGLARP